MDGWIDTWMNGRINGWMEVHVDIGKKDRQMYVCMYE